MKKTLIIYHSIQGNTELIANIISEMTGGDLLKINEHQRTHASALMMTPRIIYQSLNSNQFNSTINTIDLTDYDQIYIGSPCWYYQVTAPVKKLLSQLNFQGKDVTLFITHGGDYGQTSPKFESLLKDGRYKGMMEFLNPKTSDKTQLQARIKEWL